MTHSGKFQRVLLALLILGAALGCAEGRRTPSPFSGATVYAVGSVTTESGARAVLWRNGEPAPLAHGEDNANAKAVAVSGGSVHVAGSLYPEEGSVAALWTNGELRRPAPWPWMGTRCSRRGGRT